MIKITSISVQSKGHELVNKHALDIEIEEKDIEKFKKQKETEFNNLGVKDIEISLIYSEIPNKS